MTALSFIRLLAVATIAILNGIWVNTEKVYTLQEMENSSKNVPQFEIKKVTGNMNTIDSMVQENQAI